MSQVILKRGTKEDLKKTELQDGLLSFTIDDGKIHLDYLDADEKLQRKTFYGGKLTFGSYVYDGTTDVTVIVYDGNTEE